MMPDAESKHHAPNAPPDVPKALVLEPDDEKQLYRLSRFYWKEAQRCESAKAYLAGCVMIAAALETMLMLLVNVHPEDAISAGQLPTRKGQVKPLLTWDLGELLRVARAAQWLPNALKPDDSWDQRRALAGDHAEVVRQMRNLTHPGNYTREYRRRRITEKNLQYAFEVCLVCRDWLYERNARSLRAHLEQTK